MVTTSNCCLCFGLRTGCLIIGWMQVIFPAIGIINSIMLKIRDTKPSDESVINDSVSNSNTFWGDVIVSTLQLLLAICLLYGVYANRKRFVFYYLLVETAIILLRVILIVVFLIFAAYDDVAIVISINVVVWLILTYMLVVVYSFHEEMDGPN